MIVQDRPFAAVRVGGVRCDFDRSNSIIQVEWDKQGCVLDFKKNAYQWFDNTGVITQSLFCNLYYKKENVRFAYGKMAKKDT